MNEFGNSPLNREMQRKLLLAMRDLHPEKLRNLPSGIEDDTDEKARIVNINLLYLEGHGLCESGLTPISSGYGWRGSKITSKGLDFLEDDGGLSAILGVVTIRFDADTLRALIGAKIDATPLPEPEKSKVKKLLGTLSEAVLKVASTELIKSGLDHIPNAAAWLQTLAAS